MGRKRHTAEEIVAKRRQVDVLTAQGYAVVDAIRTISVAEVRVSFVTSRSTGKPSTRSKRGQDRDRSLETALQHRAFAFIAGIPTTGAWGLSPGQQTRSTNANAKLTFNPGRLMGDGHPSSRSAGRPMPVASKPPSTASVCPVM